MPARVIYFNFPRLLLYACCKDRTGPDRRTGVLGVKGWDVAFLAHSICACVLMSMEILGFFLHTRSLGVAELFVSQQCPFLQLVY